MRDKVQVTSSIMIHSQMETQNNHNFFGLLIEFISSSVHYSIPTLLQ